MDQLNQIKYIVQNLCRSACDVLLLYTHVMMLMVVVCGLWQYIFTIKKSFIYKKRPRGEVLNLTSHYGPIVTTEQPEGFVQLMLLSFRFVVCRCKK